MDSLERDVKFQNQPDTLRITPWLDMPKMRTHVQMCIKSRLDDGDFDYAFSEFREDILDFCTGKYQHLPNSSGITDILYTILYDALDEYSTDRRGQSRALDRISSYMLQLGSWSKANRLESEMRQRIMVEEAQAEHRPDLPF